MPIIHHILKTKFFLPPLPSDFVYRSALYDKANKLKRSSVLLISAPSGYGKSVFAASWIRKYAVKHTWLSLAETENDMQSFMLHLTLAIQNMVSHFGQDIVELCKIAEAPSHEVFSQMLVNELAELDETIVLAIDDYHLIRNREIHQIIADLIKYPIPLFKLVLISRRDPALPLSTWRIKKLLVEIRSNDLRFDKEEIGIFFSRNRDVVLKESVIKQIEEMTEGWITGLRILTLSSGKEDILDDGSSLKSFHNASHLYEVLNDVLDHQQEAIKHSLLRLSLLPEFDRELYAELCLDADQQADAGRYFDEFVDTLMRSNLFLIGLDEKHRWFRFHHLFRELLQRKVSTIYTEEEVKDFNFRIANRYLAKNEYENAIKFYLAADETGDALRAFSVVRRILFSSANWIELERIFNHFSSNRVQKYSMLQLTEAWLYIYKGNIPRMIELILPVSVLVENEKCDRKTKANLLGELNALKAYSRYNLDINMAASLQHAKTAIEQLGTDNPYATGIAWVFYGGSMQALGRSREAKQVIYELLEQSENLLVKSNLFLVLCYIYWIDGDLTELKTTASLLIRFGKENNHKEAIANGYYFSGISHYYLNQPEKAKHELQQLYKLKLFTLMIHRYFGAAALAFVQIDKINNEALQKLLYELEVMAVERGGKIYVQFTKAISSALNWIKQKEPTSLKWAQETDHNPKLPMVNFTSTPILQASILATSGDVPSIKKALLILNDSIDFLKKHNNTLFLIRSLVILSLAQAKLNNSVKSEEAFLEALELAQPRNLVLPFLILKEQLADLRKNCHLSGAQEGFIDEITASMEKEHTSPDIKMILSRRESEILGLIKTNLTNKEIGNQLHISQLTVKRHIANIYKKLNTQSRKEAIRLAEVHQF